MNRTLRLAARFALIAASLAGWLLAPLAPAYADGLEAYAADGVSDLTLSGVSTGGNGQADLYLDPPGEESGHAPYDCGSPGKDESEPAEPTVVLHFVDDDELSST
jgi:hypothetical protein